MICSLLVDKTCSPIPKPVLRLKAEVGGKVPKKEKKPSVVVKTERLSPRKRALERDSETSFSRPRKRSATSSQVESHRGGAFSLAKAEAIEVEDLSCFSETIVSPRAKTATSSVHDLPPVDYSKALLNLSELSLDISAENLLAYHESSTPCTNLPSPGVRGFLFV